MAISTETIETTQPSGFYKVAGCVIQGKLKGDCVRKQTFFKITPKKYM